jgi:molecular chaperone DnaK (HSP70)
MGTGKVQHITITASSNLSKDDIEKAVKEAEQFAAEDAKRKEEIDIRTAAIRWFIRPKRPSAKWATRLTPRTRAKSKALSVS